MAVMKVFLKVGQRAALKVHEKVEKMAVAKVEMMAGL